MIEGELVAQKNIEKGKRIDREGGLVDEDE
jgi:hypothetical protein